MDDQALRRTILLSRSSHVESDVVVAVIKDDKHGIDTEYSPEESLSIGIPLGDGSSKTVSASSVVRSCGQSQQSRS
jgi:hypothetical protein